MPASPWKPVDPKYNFKCHKCGSTQVEYSVWEASDGGHEDYHYKCKACGRDWWVDGIDS